MFLSPFTFFSTVPLQVGNHMDKESIIVIQWIWHWQEVVFTWFQTNWCLEAPLIKTSSVLCDNPLLLLFFFPIPVISEIKLCCNNDASTLMETFGYWGILKIKKTPNARLPSVPHTLGFPSVNTFFSFTGRWWAPRLVKLHLFSLNS